MQPKTYSIRWSTVVLSQEQPVTIHPMIAALHRSTSYSAVRWLATLSYTALAVILLVQPGSQPIVNLGIPPGPPSLRRELFFMAGHIVVFAGLVMLWRWSLLLHTAPSQAMILAIVAALMINVSSELAQTLISERYPSLHDLLANGVGTFAPLVWIRWRNHTL